MRRLILTLALLFPVSAVAQFHGSPSMDSVQFNGWSTAGRPTSPTAGQTGWNSTTGHLETWNGTAWLPAATLDGSNLVPLVQLPTIPSTQLSGLAAVATSGSASDLTTGTLGAARLPAPTLSTLGGVEAVAGVTHQWVSSIDTSGVAHLSQPAFVDLSGTPTTLSGYGITDALPLAGGTMTGPLHLGAQTIDGSAAAFTGGTINGTAIGGTTPAAVAATTLSASTTFTAPNLASTPTTTGSMAYNTGSGRYDFGTGTGVVNHVRLSGDTMSGPLNANGGINTTSTSGYQLNGATLLNQGTGAPTAYDGPVFFAGGYSGSVLQALSLGTAKYSVGGGYGTLQYSHVTSAENTANGTIACQMLSSGYSDTCTGEHAIGWDWTASYATMTGNDTGRNVMGTTTSNGTGFGAIYAGTPSGSVADGFTALQGNSSSINVGGTVFNVGDTIPLTFTPPTITFTGALTPCTSTTCPQSVTANSILTVTSPSAAKLFTNQTITGTGVPAGVVILDQLSGTDYGAGAYLVTGTATVGSESMSAGMAGFPRTVTYTVKGGDGATAVAQGLAALYNADPYMGADGRADFSYRTAPTPDNRVAFMWPGTSQLGYGITITSAVTGTGNETVTIGGGAIYHDNIAFGSGNMLGLTMTTAAFNDSGGSGGMPSLTTGIGNNGWGAVNFPVLTMGSYNTGIADGAGGALVSGSYNLLAGKGAGATFPINASFNIILCASQQAAGCGPTSDTGANFIVQGNSSTGEKTVNCSNTTNPHLGACTFGQPAYWGTTTFTASGCSVTSLAGSGTAGKFVSGTTGTCTPVITLNGASGMTAANGWLGMAFDVTSGTVLPQTGSTSTTITFSGSTTSGDVIRFFANPS